ncbi:FGGY family carbohydrate kinase, partial [Achromobacter sp. Bel]|uniref:FGGY family carbohydrate kinase n=1 Tax=Achromobacter sp. Bel TaxID=2727415 RepID=UPI00145E62A1
MKADIFLGIDMGSTGLKAVAFEAGTGATLATSGGAMPYRHLPGGGCELWSDAIEAALMQALRGVAEQLGPRAAEVRALCCTGHGAGLYALDEQGRLLGERAVASTDQRAAGRARRLGTRHGDALYQEVGCRPWAGQPSLVAAELFDAESGGHQAIRHLLFAKDYLGFLLSGAIATDASDVSTAGLLNLETGTWSALAFEAAGLAALMPRALPPIVPTGTVIGHLLAARAAACGLPAGLPIAMGAIDLLASLSAVGAVKSGHAVAVFGTWCVNAVVAAAREPKPEVGAIVRHGPQASRLYLENSPSSMANVAWLARTLQFEDATAAVECAMSVPLGAEGLRFLPFINGGGVAAGAAAGFVGLKGHHGRAHMARAVIDGVAALHAWHLRRLAARGLGVPGRVA